MKYSHHHHHHNNNNNNTIQAGKLAPAGGFTTKRTHIKLAGFGAGREMAARALISSPLFRVTRLTDVTPIRHGGCRPKKARRL
jgi:ribosomal protein S11